VAIIVTGGLGIWAVNNRGNAPVAHWRFDEGYASTTYDSGTGSNDGTMTGGLYWKNEPECKIGRCLSFDGTNDYVVAGNVDDGVKTVSFWFNPNSTSEYILDLDGSSYVNATSGAIGTNGFTSPTVYVNGVKTTTIVANQWQHIAITTGTSINATSTDIGRYGGNYFDGHMDEVKIYDYARTAAQIKSDYNSSAGGRGGGVSVGSVQGAQDASEGLVAHYTFDETALNGCGTNTDACDSSGTNHLAAIADASPTSTAKYGYAAMFDGTGDYYCSDTDDDGSCEDDNDLDMGTSDFTIEAWVNSSTDVSDWRYLVSKRTAGSPWTGYELFINKTTGVLYAQIYDGSDVVGPSSVTAIHDDAWHHIALVADRDGNAQLYIDGVADGSAVDMTSVDDLDNASNFIVGHTGSSGVIGQIDDIKIYKTARSASQIRRDYETGPPPVAHWKMDENSGDTAYDTSGANDGDLQGSCPGAATCPIWAAGKYGNAMQFDGSDDYVSISSVPVAGSHITFSMWLYINATSSSHVYFGRYGSSYALRNYHLRINQDTSDIVARIWNVGVNEKYETSAYSLETERWYFVSLLYSHDGTTGTLSLYVDGKLHNTNTGGAYDVVSSAISLGTDVNQNYGYYNGKVDDVRIYNYVRTQKQIMQDMNAGHPAVGSPVGSYVGYWKFDEGYGQTVYDMSLSGNDGTLASSTDPNGADPTWTQSGKFGGALSFDGGDDYVSMGDISNSIDLSSNSWTLSTWVDYNSNGDYDRILAFLTGASGTYLGIMSSNKLVWGTNDGSWHEYQSVSVIDSGWHQVGLMRDGSTMNFIIDGQLKPTTFYSINSTSNFIVGKASYRSSSYFNGSIDEVKIYPFALTPQEVLLEYNGGATLKLGSLSAPPTGGAGSGTSTDSASIAYCVPGGTDACDPPVAHWKMDEMTGSTIYDTAGANDGDLNLDSGDEFATSSAWQVTGCHAGSCIDFDGTDDYVIGGSVSTGVQTVSFWFNPDSTSEYILDLDGSSYVNATSGTVGTNGFTSPTVYVDGAISSTIVVNKWQHITITTGTSINATSTDIGRYGGNYFDGKIDDVRIYNYARTPAQIAWDYNRGAPIGWWKMDEGQDTATTCNATGATVYDYSGNSNNGTLTLGAAPTVANARVEGKYSCALDFDGTDDYTSVGDLSVETQTIAFWANPDSASEYILDLDGSSYLNATSGAIGTNGFTSPTVYVNGVKTTTIVADQWQHIAITSDTGIDATSTDIGRYGGNYFDGTIDDVRIYNYALTPIQIDNVYNEGSAVRFGPSSGLP